jgi:hypothetical protein
VEITINYIVLGVTATTAVTLITFLFKFAAWKGSVDSDRRNFHEFMNEIRVDMREIRNDIKRIFDRLPLETTGSSSPIGLTDLGESVSKEIDAKS